MFQKLSQSGGAFSQPPVIRAGQRNIGAVAFGSLTLLRHVKDIWTPDELKRVKAVAKMRGVRLDFE